MFKTQLNEKQTIQQLINTFCNTHDLVCDCDEPTKHIFLHIFSNGEPYQVTKKQKLEIEKCLITTDADGTDIVDDTGINPGDLERLFAEDDAGENTDG